MKKIVAFLKAWFLKEEGKISISKMLATVAMLCATVIALQSQLVSLGITIPPALIPYFKAATVISGLIAFIRVRNNQLADPSTPATTTSSNAGTGTPGQIP